ncbi:MAG: hypothetical protein H6Q73_974 [Firmicutes bacterium]|nr:hypothetical protein [Bacillota bacterium]
MGDSQKKLLGEAVNISYRTTTISYRLDYLIEHCILAVAFFLPMSLNVGSGFLALGTLLWLAKMVRNRHFGFRATPFDLPVAVLVVLSAASVFMSPDRNFSFYNYYNLMGRYIVIYYLVINNIHSAEQVKRLLRTVLVSASLVAVYGLYQYSHGMDISAVGWVDGDQFPKLKMRMFSTLENPNLLAGFLVIMMSLATGMGLSASSRKMKVMLFTLVIVFGMCLALTYSRGAWLSVLAVVVLLGILYDRRIFWILAFIPVMLLVGHDVFFDRLMSIANPTDTSSALRIALWESTVAMIKDHPFLGIGWGAYWLVYPAYDFYVQDPGTTIFHAHNMFLHIPAEIGIPGSLFYFGLMIGHAWAAFRLTRHDIDRQTAGLMFGILASIVSIVVSGFTDYVLFNIQLSMLYWLLNAVVVLVWINYGRYH